MGWRRCLSQTILPAHQRGKPREFEDVNLASSAYMPPFRPSHLIAQTSLHRGSLLAPRYNCTRSKWRYLMRRASRICDLCQWQQRVASGGPIAPLLSHGLLPFCRCIMG
jgi:hypothetical protein